MKKSMVSGSGPDNILMSLFEECSGVRAESSVPLSSSGSNRKYFRISGGGKSLVGVAGTDVKENEAFVCMAGHFRSKGLRVPEVMAVSADGLYYLQEDLGDCSLFDAVAAGRESGNYSPQEKSLLLETISCLPEIQFKGAEGLDFSVCWPEPEFNRRMVMADLNYFKYCFLKATGLEFNEAALEKDFELLAEKLLEGHDYAFMYRDFQARNVMIHDGKPYFIDFQGGKRGPVHYDVASFVWQARARYPEPFRDGLVQAYIDAAGQYARIDAGLFRRRLKLFVLFRTLQVLGAYGFRGLFERKPHFLRSIPYAMENLRGILAEPPVGCPYLVPLLRSVAGLPQFALSGQDGADVGKNGISRESMDGADAGGGSGVSVESVARVDAGQQSKPLEVKVCSFSYKKGLPEDPSGNGGGYVFDCRALPNPGRYEYYRQFTGMDAEVVEFFRDKAEVPAFLGHVFSLADAHVERFIERGFTHLMICFGCTGGQHRSVYCAERTAEHLAGKHPGIRVTVVHREQNVKKKVL